ncbi:MAG: aminotransferase class V-fold PLP-dependent enzyme [Anaerolineae bacterium]
MDEQLLQDVAARAARYLNGLDERSVAPSQEAVDALRELDVPLPNSPTDPAEVIALLDRVGSPATYAMAGGRYFGFVIGGSVPASVAANWLSVAWDNNAGLKIGHPIGVKLEQIALRWTLDLLGMPAESAGVFVTGATMANFTCLAAARHWALERVGWDAENDGLFGAPPITVVIGDEAHSSVIKALGMVGLGRKRVIRVPTDEQGRMIASAFPESLPSPAIVILQAGNVNTGAFDPLDEVIDKAHALGAWVHVDGAFGLWAAASPTRKHLIKGFEKADSWATDAHKWLNVPYDSGIAFVRDAAVLRATMAMGAAYLIRGEEAEPSDYSPELSRRGRGIDAWAALLSLGKQGTAAMIDRCCDHAQTFAAGLRAAGFEVPHEVVLNQVLVRFGDDDTTLRVIKAIQEEGTMWASSTRWHGKAALRISVSSWATTNEDVQRSLDAMIRCAKREMATVQ